MAGIENIELIDAVIQSLKNRSGPIAIGFDVAAQEDNWGLCVLLLDVNLQHGSLKLLLPSPMPEVQYAKYQILHQLLEVTVAASCGGAMAVDVPFGWPDEHRRFVDHWSATAGWNDLSPLPERDEFERRLTAVRLRRLDVKPLAVGSDKIACAAFKWAQCRMVFGELLGSIDVGLPMAVQGKMVTFETYPGAFVNINLPREIWSYKKKHHLSNRRRIWNMLTEVYPLDNDERSALWIEHALTTAHSDAFDSLLCAFAAWDYLRWRRGFADVTLTTPDRLLGEEFLQYHDQILREGWMLVRTDLGERLRQSRDPVHLYNALGPRSDTNGVLEEPSSLLAKTLRNTVQAKVHKAMPNETELRARYNAIVEGSLAPPCKDGHFRNKWTVEIRCAETNCPKLRRIATSDLHQTTRCEEHAKEYGKRRRSENRKKQRGC